VTPQSAAASHRAARRGVFVTGSSLGDADRVSCTPVEQTISRPSRCRSHRPPPPQRFLEQACDRSLRATAGLDFCQRPASCGTAPGGWYRATVLDRRDYDRADARRGRNRRWPGTRPMSDQLDGCRRSGPWREPVLGDAATKDRTPDADWKRRRIANGWLTFCFGSRRPERCQWPCNEVWPAFHCT